MDSKFAIDAKFRSKVDLNKRKKIIFKKDFMMPLDEMKEKSEKVGLKLNIQKTKIMAPGPITSWEIDGETVETVSDFISWAPKSLQMVTAAMKLKDTYFLEEKL